MYNTDLTNNPNLRDLTGQKFGKLTVIERCEDHVTSSGKHMVKWLCKCDCGRKKKVLSTSLKNGFSTSCGCYANKVRRTKRDTPNSNAEDLIGKVFGLLTVVKEIKPYRIGGLKYRCVRCQCVCGKYKDVRANQLKSGTIISCGCTSPRIFKKIKDLILSNTEKKE